MDVLSKKITFISILFFAFINASPATEVQFTYDANGSLTSKQYDSGSNVIVDFEPTSEKYVFWESGDNQWVTTSSGSVDGFYSVAPQPSITSELTTHVTTVAGEISFYLDIKSEACCAKTSFYINDVLLGEWENEQDFTKETFSVSAAN